MAGGAPEDPLPGLIFRCYAPSVSEVVRLAINILGALHLAFSWDAVLLLRPGAFLKRTGSCRVTPILRFPLPVFKKTGYRFQKKG